MPLTLSFFESQRRKLTQNRRLSQATIFKFHLLVECLVPALQKAALCVTRSVSWQDSRYTTFKVKRASKRARDPHAFVILFVLQSSSFFLISLSTILHLGLCRRFELDCQIKLPKMHCAVNLCPKKAFFLAAGQGSMWQNLCAAACLLIGLIGTV